MTQKEIIRRKVRPACFSGLPGASALFDLLSRAVICQNHRIAQTISAHLLNASRFDPASLEILRQLGRITESQDALVQLVRNIHLPDSREAVLGAGNAARFPGGIGAPSLPPAADGLSPGWARQQPESASSTPSVAPHTAALRWLGSLTGNDPGDVLPDSHLAQSLDSGFLDGDSTGEDDLTPLQRATRSVDRPATSTDTMGSSTNAWQSTSNIGLVNDEDALFSRFVRRLCGWVSVSAWEGNPLTSY
jgi:hypothetical protein